MRILFFLGISILTVIMAYQNPPTNHGCTMCPFESDSFVEFTKHVSSIHKNDPRLKIYCDFGNCGFSTKSWSSFKVHVSKKHPERVQYEGAQIDYEGLDEFMNVDDAQDLGDMALVDLHAAEDRDKHKDNMLMASYTLYMEGTLRMSEKAANCVVENTAHLVHHHLYRQKAQFQRLRQQQGIELHLDNDINLETSYISEFATKYRRDKFYKEYCRMVEPVEVVLGTRNKEVRGVVKVVKSLGYYVPLERLLQALLQLPDLQYVIENPHNSTTGFMFDVCDGHYLKDHPLFGTDKRALQLLLYTDDIQVANPLGTHTKQHKITVFYMMILNMRPEDRSRLSAIFLVAIAKAENLARHGTVGVHKLLQDFFDTVNQLSSDGIVFDVGNEKRRLKGGLVGVIADTPAANVLGGFKGGSMVNSPIFNIKFEHFPNCQPTWMIYHHEAHDLYFFKMVVVSVWLPW